jgi:hypothetical protein
VSTSYYDRFVLGFYVTLYADIDVSEEYTAVKAACLSGKTVSTCKVRSDKQKNLIKNIPSLKMEAAFFSETTVSTYKRTQ